MLQRSMIYLFLLVIGLAGTLVPTVKSEDQDKPRSDVRMTLSSKSLMLCVGSRLPLDLEIANQGVADVKIDKFDLWNQYEYGFLGTRGSGRGGGRGSSCSHCRGNYIVLQPGTRYESSYEFLLDDFFKDAGKYTIKMKYGHVSTNELTFELYDCNPQ
jgi:hypothetical protein